MFLLFEEMVDLDVSKPFHTAHMRTSTEKSEIKEPREEKRFQVE